MISFLLKGRHYLQHSLAVPLGFVGGKALQRNREIHVGVTDEVVG